MSAALILLLLATVSEPEPENTESTESASGPVDAVIASAQLTVQAKQLIRTAPKYPMSELYKGREAWVHITYCIDESGSVQNISILDSVGNEMFDQAAIDTIEQWKFEPALKNGEPVWQSRNDVWISFAIEDDLRGAKRSFRKSYKDLGKLIEDGELLEADALFWKIYQTADLNMFELTMLWALRVRYEGKIGDTYKLDMALHRATASNGEWISKKSYAQLLSLRSSVELQLGKYHEARHSYNDLVDVLGEDAEKVVELRPMFERLRTMIESDQILAIKAEVRARGECAYCNDSWNFSPVRNDFKFSNINGTLKSIDMRCDNKRFESDVTELVEWHIPESWGTCRIHIYGEPGTTFDVLMLPAAVN